MDDESEAARAGKITENPGLNRGSKTAIPVLETRLRSGRFRSSHALENGAREAAISVLCDVVYSRPGTIGACERMTGLGDS